tara:strand:+ start:1004 stop:1636 length:633 start_codon:yes stop_codon:yes gene_type:complete
MSEFGYIPEAPEQSAFNNKGIFTPTDIYNLDQVDKWTQLGQLELIETINASGVSAVAFDDVFGDYNVHLLTFNNLSKNAGAGGYISMKFSADGGSSYTGNYAQALNMAEGTNFFDIKNTNYGSVRIGQHGDATSEPSNGYCYLYNFTDSTKYSFVTQKSSNTPNSGVGGMIFGSHVHTTAQANNYLEIKYYFSSANLTGNLSLYGIKEYE